MSTTTKQLAEAFIRWPLPKSVRSDECATVRQEGRIGTNLMTYVEAEKMFTDIVGPTLAENAALLIDCDAKRLRLAECRAENAALRAALERWQTLATEGLVHTLPPWMAGMVKNIAEQGQKALALRKEAQP